jgi:G patch domain-containing protein 1
MAAGDSDSEDYITVGTPIERELEARAGARKAAAQDPGSTKALPVWKQAATDEQGRRRFHGAFTGGFSAGYYNTVGSKEGWAPAAFVSSRSARADASTRRDARDYMDADELAEAVGADASALTTRKEYDTFGAAASQAAHAAADRERAAADGERPSVLPGAVFSDLVVPVSDPIGARLLRKMGWRAGKGIGRKGAALLATDAAPSADAAAGDAAGSAAHAARLAAAVEALQAGEEVVIAGEEAEAHDEAAGGAGDDEELGVEAEDAQAAATAQRLRRRRRRWGTVAGALADDVRVEVPPPKRDTHGLGYDPFSGAEEFRAIKRSRGELAAPNAAQPASKRGRGGAFGVGVFEAADDDVYGGLREETHFEIAAGSDDEDEAARFGGALGSRAPPRLALGAAPTRLALGAPTPAGTLPGFVVAAAVEPPPKVFPPPQVPRGWQPQPKFTTPLAPPPLAPPPMGRGPGAPPPPPPPPPPADEELVKRCDTLADFVARNGPGFEELARGRQRDDPRFAFLFGGPGAEYYAWRCSQLRAAPAPQRPEQRSRPLTAEERGRILGEERLPAEPVPWQQGQGVGSAFAPPAAELPPPPPPPPPKGIAQGDRAALLASLGRTFTSESKPSAAQPKAAPQTYGLRPGVNLLANKFASGGTILPGAAEERGAKAAEAAEAPKLPAPTRVSEDWGPEPLLCKRLGVPDPYKGRPRPAERRTFRTDSFELPETAQEAADAAPKFLAAEPATAAAAAALPAPPPPLSFLPPPPPLPPAGMPPERPAAAPLLSSAAGVVDSTALADDFFASLGGPGAPPAAAPEAPVVMRPSAKPIDLFKAIFEADDDDDDDDDGPDEDMPPATEPAAAAVAAAGAPPPAPPPSGPFTALAALAREHEERRRKEKSKKKEHKKHKSKKEKKEKRDKKEKRSKRKHASRSRSSSSSTPSG